MKLRLYLAVLFDAVSCNFFSIGRNATIFYLRRKRLSTIYRAWLLWRERGSITFSGSISAMIENGSVRMLQHPMNRGNENDTVRIHADSFGERYVPDCRKIVDAYKVK